MLLKPSLFQAINLFASTNLVLLVHSFVIRKVGNKKTKPNFVGSTLKKDFFFFSIFNFFIMSKTAQERISVDEKKHLLEITWL